MAGGSAAHELLLADYMNDVVRAFDLQSDRLDERNTFKTQSGELLDDVAYSSETGVLFVATRNKANTSSKVRSFVRTSNRWDLRDQMEFEREMFGTVILRVLLDGNLFVSDREASGVRVCHVHIGGTFWNCTRLALPGRLKGFDVQLSDDGILLAAIPGESASLAFFRVDEERNELEELSNVRLPGAKLPLFCGDNLLVAHLNPVGFYEAELFTTRGDRLQRVLTQIPLPEQEGYFSNWWFVNETLFVLDIDSRDLLFYDVLQ